MLDIWNSQVIINGYTLGPPLPYIGISPPIHWDLPSHTLGPSIITKCVINTVSAWNPSITDTIGTSKLAFLMEVSFVEESLSIKMGQVKCPSLVVRCPLFRGVPHCTCISFL